MKKALLCVLCGMPVLAGCSSDVIYLDSACETCTDSQICCSGICTNIMTNTNACGACGIVCDKDEICIQGNCRKPYTCDTCETGMVCCENGCADLDTSLTNCGACGRKCPEGTTCSGGECLDKLPDSCDDSCSDNRICCEGICVYTDINPQHCGECNHACDNDELCLNGKCQCQPKSCAELNKACGMTDDGCGNTLDCGTCPDHGECTNGICDCVPKSCAELNKTCGMTDNGCGNTLDCGMCDDGKTCQNGACVCVPKTCEDLGWNCGTADDGCGGTIDCGSCSGNQTCQSNVCQSPSIRDTYPKRKSIKGLQPDFQDVNQVIGNETHGVAMNLVWALWQPEKKTECSSNEIKYDGYCFKPNDPNPAQNAAAIKTYTDAGVLVTAVIYGTPDWARRSCADGSVVNEWFCAPLDENAIDYGRFVGFLAHYFNGENGHGRIADFVIHNEVNASEWFNIGCTQGTCNVDKWTSVYADSWNAAYDYARNEQKEAKVLISFEHHFGSTYDSMLNNARPVVSAQTFLGKLIPKLGNRDWRIAWHSYPPNLADPAFGANDWPRITFGNIGVIAGWLRQNYPNDPHAWEIQLTENGLNGKGATMQQRQRTQLCQAFENILGTPGIENFIYHRLIDIAEEGLNLGLWNADGSPKPAWEMFALANRNLGNGWPACGFQYLPYVRMKRGSNSSSMHWITTRQFPSGFNFERAWKILREPAENTKLVYECRVGGSNGNHAMISTDPACEGQFNMGPMGYVYTSQIPGTSPIYRCYAANGSHFVSPASDCEGQKTESLIGYAIQE